MTVQVAQERMTSEEIVRLSKEHTFFSWSVQGAVDPIAIDHAEGVLAVHPRRTAHSRLQQSVDVGEHRAR